MNLHDLIQDFQTLRTRYFSLRSDILDKDKTYESIVNGIEFKGTNLWILVFAVFVASLGLNMNSVAVIIGAMLISPLMGPIMGLGLGLGIRDPQIITRSLKNLAVATLFSMLTSCFYFLISPLNEARSELLARTNPTIYDVLIAFFGGMAGIIATGSKEKGNVLPGVAIATALMPPLCTSGYGLATAQWNFFFGAFYLYMINCVYIGFATWLGVRILKLPKRDYEDQRKKKRILKATSAMILLTAMPSFYITYKMVKENFIEGKVNTFVSKEFSLPYTQVINKQIITDADKKKVLEVSLIGESIPKDSLNIISSKMPLYGLNDMQLRVVQGYSPSENMSQEVLNTTLMQEILKENKTEIAHKSKIISSLEQKLSDYTTLDSLGTIIAPEMKIFFPQVKDLAIANTYINSVDTLVLKPVTMALIYVSEPLNSQQVMHLKEWLGVRIDSKNIQLYIEKQ